jgi:predicted phosphohydrolase
MSPNRRFQFCSDLHVEFPVNKVFLHQHPLVPSAELLVIAGDFIPFAEIGKHNDYLDLISEQFKLTLWVPGNHEYYRSDITERGASFKENVRHNIILANNVTFEYANTRFLLSTLWSAVSPETSVAITRAMADFHLIKKSGRKITVDDYNAMHHECRQFLESALNHKTDMNTVVVTHHIPTFHNYPAKYSHSNLNTAFATELSELIVSSRPGYWIFGHHHQPVPDFRIGDTVLVNNQLGYVEFEEHPEFRPDRVLAI